MLAVDIVGRMIGRGRAEILQLKGKQRQLDRSRRNLFLRRGDREPCDNDCRSKHEGNTAHGCPPLKSRTVPISFHPLSARNRDLPWIDRVKCPILAGQAFFSTKSASKCRAGVKQSLPQVPRLQALDFIAGRARAIDLKLRLALRVAALAAVCFLAVAAYALFDSDRVARAKVSHIAEIVARDISLQQAQAHWFSLSAERTAGFATGRGAADGTGSLRRLSGQGRRLSAGHLQRCARRGSCRTRKLRSTLSRHFPSRRTDLEAAAHRRRDAGRGGRNLRPRHADRPELARDQPPAFHHGVRAGGTLPCGLCRAGARAAADTCHSDRTEAACGERSFRTTAQFRSRGTFGYFRYLQRAGAEASGHARRTQRADATS